ncbi:DEAD/DEAH box helicase [Kyrpidia sp.]|uniref:DEAD/DEAH box helicase n=1 Tax=Kyrpidia sp. TaxID=2073077 RepID=UPI0025881871|nr:DEAD/DEAH box helicase [Kyrpidia sp.]MCL6576729.1 DEAD/DEAH box helicase [Kyrpidia sp.]
MNTTFTIPAHGVAIGANGLSEIQTALVESYYPIRICGAPTGAGKTYAFLQAARSGQFVVFVVPTQALAADIEQTCRKQNVSHRRWDAVESKKLASSGKDVYETRLSDVEELERTGGLLVTTPESLAQVLHGRYFFAGVPLRTSGLLGAADHLVFDEAHTYTERGFGFLSFWLTAIAYRSKIDPNTVKPKLTLLSATHSNLFEEWLKDKDVPPSSWIALDEHITEKPTPNFRWLHGDVQVSVTDVPILDLFFQYGEEKLLKNRRVLLLYDSLWAMLHDLKRLSSNLSAFGITKEEVFVVDAQDKQSAYTLGSESFRSGLEPEEHHRLIIGTSAIEMGVNYPDLTCAFLQPGIDAASLVQRIGRVARGNYRGEIFISSAGNEVPAHIVSMKDLSGIVPIEELRSRLSPLRTIHPTRAKALGSAYWSFLEQQPGHLRDFLVKAHGTLSTTSTPGGLLNAIRAKIKNGRSRHRRELETWLHGIDRALGSLRDFSPTVRVQFGMEANIVEYSRDWMERYVNCRAAVVSDDGVWRFPGPRDQFLRERPEPVIRYALHPFGPPIQIVVDHRPSNSTVQRFLSAPAVQSLSGEDRNLWELIEKFVRETGLLVFQHDDLPPGDSLVI